jgi:hypothetical protein
MDQQHEVLPFTHGTVADLFGQAQLLGGQPDDFLPEVGMERIDRVSSQVDMQGVSLHSTIVWQGTTTPFAHSEKVGEKWMFDYLGAITFRDGASWDTRTPILHPAVAAVDATQAGYDDAYLRAMQNVDILVGIQKDESRVAIRRMVERYSKLQYSPYRMLVRGAVLWAIVSRQEMKKPGMTPYESTGCPLPVRIGDVGGYSNIARRQLDTMNDVAYIRCESANELYMVEVMHAMCSGECPVETDMTLQKLWPPLMSPYVLYTALEPVRFGTGKLDAYQIEATLQRFADVFDCHDLLQEALQAVQFFMCRPVQAGLLGGAGAVVWATPKSDMRIGAIGPLLAGVSAEGMRTTPFVFPRFTTYAYGAAVRGCFVTASYFEALLTYDDTHQVVRSVTGASQAKKYKLLADLNAGRHFMEKRVQPLAIEAGWNCLVRSLLSVTPRDTARFTDVLFRAANVPWWTNVIAHLRDGGHKFVSTWARPARIMGMPLANKWHNYRVLEGVTAKQMAAAVRWLGAEVRYCIDEYGRARRWEVMEAGSINRFLPNLMPVVKYGRGVLGVAAIRFTDAVYEGMTFLEMLGRSEVTIVKEDLVDELPSAIDMMEAFLPDMPHLFEDAEGAALGEPPQTPPPSQPEDIGVGELEPPPPQPRDDVDWDKVAADLEYGRTHIEPAVLKTALTAGRWVSSPPYNAASLLASANIEARLKDMPPEVRIDYIRAMILAMGRLAVHASTPIVNESLAVQQRTAVSLLSSLYDAERPVVNWADEVEAEKAAEAVLAKSQEVNEGKVPVARDDPSGQSETVQDFGRGTSVIDLTAAAHSVTGVPQISQTGLITFGPPPPM